MINELLVLLAQHCREVHPSPWQRPFREPGGSQLADVSGSCSACEQLNPSGFFDAWHHTDPAAAQAIAAQQQMISASGWVYFTSIRTAAGRTRRPGICPSGTGAVVHAKLPAQVARLDALLPDGEINWRIHVDDLRSHNVRLDSSTTSTNVGGIR
ncbi:hypothetical protein ACFV9C_42370 [Kribbella sp. NPDC059898]|uniref:hypothetical protein n=1 Tax=Kribbella sp. NPDC059898 TaxID=3346995 RepID=UPI0036613A37